MRKTITISVSDEMYELIYKGTHAHYYSTVSEYIRFLVRRDQRPDSIKEEEVVYAPVKTANQCIEDAIREHEAARKSLGNKGINLDL